VGAFQLQQSSVYGSTRYTAGILRYTAGPTAPTVGLKPGVNERGSCGCAEYSESENEEVNVGPIGFKSR